jgi:hypothetical protein
MMSKKTRFLLGAFAVVAVAMLGSPAQAKLWTATYDPPQYIGTGTFEVPDVCLSTASDGGHLQSEFGVGCIIQIMGNVSITPAVDFASILPLGLCASCQYEVLGGALAGINTGVIGSVDVGDVDYWFQFQATFIPGNNEDVPPSVTNVVNLYKNCGFEDNQLFCGDPAFSATEGTVFSVVPEPGSLALIVGALGAGWIVRRRKTIL